MCENYSELAQNSVAVFGEDLVGASPSFNAVKKAAWKVAKRHSTVLILGETGTGKQMLAKYIHQLSSRSTKPFIPVDCLALAETLFESELFGHVKGAFTGAVRDSMGFVRAANGGTLFLDEIGELSLRLQGKLLRLLQEQLVIAVGDVHPQEVDVRILAATNKNLYEMVEEGTFREDLFFRLGVVTITLPPLRERPEDILPLAEHFLHKQAELYNEPRKILSSDVAAALQQYRWPGNIRQLANVMEHAHVLTEGGAIDMEELPHMIQRQCGCVEAETSFATLEQVEQRVISDTLERTGYCKAETARILDVNIQRLNRLIDRLDVQMP